MTPYELAWLAVLLAGSALELVAVATHHIRGTASALIRRIGGIDPPRWWRHISRVVIVAACALLALHLGWDIPSV